jgi:osmotically-inducible protein OsmY
MISNSKLYAKVMAKLRFEPGLDQSDITVAIKSKNGIDNIVVLGGKVGTYAEKQIAEEAVEKIETVRGVANELEVDISSKDKKSDADIVQAALDSLRWTVLIPDEKIKVAVDKGCITLVGEVEYYYEKDRAYNAVKNLPGVTHVINEIKVAASVSPVDVKDNIRDEFERNARIDANNIQVEVEGSEVTLKGEVRSLDEYREAENAAWAVPGVTEVMTSQLYIR